VITGEKGSEPTEGHKHKRQCFKTHALLGGSIVVLKRIVADLSSRSGARAEGESDGAVGVLHVRGDAGGGGAGDGAGGGGAAVLRCDAWDRRPDGAPRPHGPARAPGRKEPIAGPQGHGVLIPTSKDKSFLSIFASAEVDT